MSVVLLLLLHRTANVNTLDSSALLFFGVTFRKAHVNTCIERLKSPITTPKASHRNAPISPTVHVSRTVAGAAPSNTSRFAMTAGSQT